MGSSIGGPTLFQLVRMNFIKISIYGIVPRMSIFRDADVHIFNFDIPVTGLRKIRLLLSENSLF